MSVSSVAAPLVPVVKPPEVTITKAPDVKTDQTNDDSRSVQPTAKAPLPPGQGTRVDQLA
jgi:hypothetical protein